MQWPSVAMQCCCTEPEPTAALVKVDSIVQPFPFDKKRTPAAVPPVEEMNDQFAQVQLPEPGSAAEKQPFKREVQDFTITVNQAGNPDTPMGLLLDCHFKRMAVVRGIQPNGLVAQYNQTATKENGQDVRVTDFLLGVNDCCNDTDAMVTNMKTGRPVNLTFRRVKSFQATIFTADGLGMELNPNNSCVVSVTPGGVKEYNRRADAGCLIIPGDIIAEIDDRRERSAREINQELTATALPKWITLTVRRS